MAIDAQTLTIEAAAWCNDTAFYIAKSLQHAPLENVQNQVNSGAAQAFHIKAGGRIVGAFVLRVDQLETHSEGVVVAAAAELEGVDMVANVMPAIEGMFSGCKTIRYHTANAALARKMRGLGYQPREIVCMKDLDR